jgi:hypothetical protein
MEYTSVLAGEPFSDAPPCVDAELAAVLRGANDVLSDEKRPALVPLLGRAIGLVVRGPERRPAGRLLRLRRRPPDGTDVLVARLRLSVADRLVRGVGLTPADSRWRWYSRQAHVSQLFWDLMTEPDALPTSALYVDRLIARLDLLHRCYEDAMAELGLAPVSAPVDVEAPAPSGERAAAEPAPVAP